MSKEYITENLSIEDIAELTDEMLKFERNKKSKNNIKISLLKLIPAVAAIALVIGFINLFNILPDVPDSKVGKNGEDIKANFIEHEFKIDDCIINVALPERFNDRHYIIGDGELFYEIHKKDIELSERSVLIAENGSVVGAIDLYPKEISEKDFEYFKEDTENRFWSIYQFITPILDVLPGRGYWGENYKIAYESKNKREGSATTIPYYFKNHLDYNNIMDFSHFSAPKTEPYRDETDTIYSNKGIVGYNYDLQKIVRIEFYYDAVTDEELTQIAETLRIQSSLTFADIEKINVGDSRDFVHETLGEPHGYLFGLLGDIYSLQNGHSAIIYYDADSIVSKIVFNINGDWMGNLDGKRMTLDDIRELAKKGDSLRLQHLQQFSGLNASSSFDYYIMVYSVEGGYRLVVHTTATGKPASVNLESVWESGGSGIDIRYGDIDEFLRNHPSHEVETTTESPPVAPAINYEYYCSSLYGFGVNLPESWKGYNVIISEWSGVYYNNDGTVKATEKGPMFEIRPPAWTEDNPSVYLPLMVMTYKQWYDASSPVGPSGLGGPLVLDAAGMAPRELARNEYYVIALPPRYYHNNWYLENLEGLADIIESGAVQGISMIYSEDATVGVPQIGADDIQPNPDHIVEREEYGSNSLLISGYGDAYLSYSPNRKNQIDRREGTYLGVMYMARSMPIPQLENERIEGGAGLRSVENILDISFTVSRPDPYSGTVSGPGVKIVYNADTDKIEELVCTPYDVLNMQGEKEDHYEFDFAEENALAMGRMIYEAMQICMEYVRVNDLMD